jgi:hypothetical protein
MPDNYGYGETLLTENASEAAVIAALGERAGEAKQIIIPTERGDEAHLDAHLVKFLVPEGSRVETVDLADYLPRPLRQAGHVALRDHTSLIEYVAGYLHPTRTTLWGDVDKATVSAVLDDHERRIPTLLPDSPTVTTAAGAVLAMADSGIPLDDLRAGWGQHRATLTLRLTPEWKAWTGADGRLMTQGDFAEFIEDNAQAIAQPDPATFLEIAQTFQAKRNLDFESGHRVQSGEVAFVYKETMNAKAGQKGQLSIPDAFTLNLAPFEGGDVFPILARFRYRIVDGTLGLGFRLHRPDEVKLLAFNTITGQVSDALGLPVLAGTPR